MPEPLKLLTDQAISRESEDALAFAAYANVIKSVIIGTDGPFTIGIFGEWGTGKTSLMKVIESYFESHEKGDTQVIPIWFNAWQYENVDHPIVPLVATIITELERNQPALETLEDKGKNLIRSLRSIAYGFSVKSKVKIPGFAEVEAGFVAKDMLDRDDKLRYDPLLEKNLYYRAFEALNEVKLINDGKGVKVLIIINDLDRCFPGQAVKLLESIKLILSQPGFLFVLGVSRDVIEKYLQHRYQNEYGIDGLEGRAYLDKIIQLAFDIPPHKARMEEFAKHLIVKLVDKDSQAQLLEIAPVIGAACKDNPRTVTRFINRLLIDQAIYTELSRHNNKSLTISLGLFAVSRSLQMQWRDFFDIFQLSDDSQKNPVARALIAHFDKTETILLDPAPAEIEIVRMVKETLLDKNLANLLVKSKIGQEWLKDWQRRRTTIDFIGNQSAVSAPTLSALEILEQENNWPLAWSRVLKKIKSTNNSLASLLGMYPATINGNTITITPRFNFHRDLFMKSVNKATITQACEEILGYPVNIKAVTVEHPKKDSDDLIANALEVLGGELD